MKAEIVLELLKIMLRKFRRFSLMLNLLYSYDGSKRRRDRSKRSLHREGLWEGDIKQQRRHRKPLNQQNGDKLETVRAKVSANFRIFKIFHSAKRNTFDDDKNFKVINCSVKFLEVSH